MCGIVGFWGFNKLAINKVKSVVLDMARNIYHRGPDDEGVWIEENSQIALAHRRLSILDLSSAGHQPMISSSGRYVLIFNGEIYNHLELRKDYENEISISKCEIRWNGHSDTETLLRGIELWGLERTLKRSNGMFSIALWDRQKKLLFLARDRLGEKPLYCGSQSGVLLFGSELKSIKGHPSFKGIINRDALALQLRYSYIPCPYSIYEGIFKIPPGTIVCIESNNIAFKEYLEKAKPYWSLQNTIEKGKSNMFTASDTKAVDTLERLLVNSVSRQMISDVPLGAFLSGGIDSTAIVAILQSLRSKPVKTYTIGFHENIYNEAIYAKHIAKYLGTDHTELYISPEKALSVIPKLPTLYDEPFADPSQIPTYLVSELTQNYVKVSLSGDGGDELFGGYGRHFETQKWWGSINCIPFCLRKYLSNSMSYLPPQTWNMISVWLKHITFKKANLGDLGNKIFKIQSVFSAKNKYDLYRHFISHWDNPEKIVINSRELHTQITESKLDLKSVVEEIMALDTLNYLPDDILVKVDRAAMAVSLETRVPMLDHEIVDFAWRLPLSMKIRNGSSKWILRQVLYKYVPKNLMDRPKMGFGVPIDSWLRGPLRNWAECLLNESRLRNEGFFNPLQIRQKWDEHLSGKSNWQYLLWNVLMFQAWYEKNK